jgi:hypothetical protein
MNQQQIIDTFRQVMPRIHASGSPEDELLKYASANNLAPAVLEKLAQTFNTAKTLKVYKTASVEVERGRSFHIIDVPDLLQRYTGWKDKSATSRGLSSEAQGWLEVDENVKSASEGATFHARVPNFVDQAVGFQRYEIDPDEELDQRVVKAASTPLNVTLHELDILNGTIDEHRFRLHELFELQKTAARNSPSLAKEILHDMRAVKGIEVEWAMRKFASWCNANGAPQRGLGEPDTRPLAEDRHKAASWMQDVLDTVTVIRACAGYGKDMAKAANALDWERAMEQTENAYTKDVPAERLAEFAEPDLSAGASQVLSWEPPGKSEEGPREEESSDEEEVTIGRGNSSGGSKSKAKPERPRMGPLESSSGGRRKIDPNALASGGLSNFVTGRVDKMFRNQQISDEATDNLQAATVVTRLMLTDEVLREADPDVVISQFNTIRRANPEIAKDENLLRMALQEAVQYGGLPMHSYDQLLDTRNKAMPKKPEGGGEGKRGPGINLSLLGL